MVAVHQDDTQSCILIRAKMKDYIDHDKKKNDDTYDDVNDAGTSVRPATLLESPSTIST